MLNPSLLHAGRGDPHGEVRRSGPMNQEEVSFEQLAHLVKFPGLDHDEVVAYVDKEMAGNLGQNAGSLRFGTKADAVEILVLRNVKCVQTPRRSFTEIGGLDAYAVAMRPEQRPQTRAARRLTAQGQ